MPPSDRLTLVIDTATAACSVALLAEGAVVARRHAVVGRGHAERLVPMIAELPGGGRAAAILVDCGPGSFTGIRVGLAAARGLGLGWGAPVAGYSSTALIAAGAFARGIGDEADGGGGRRVAVVLEGGHGEVFMQGYAAFDDAGEPRITATDTLVSLAPAAAIAALDGRVAVGSGVGWLAALDPAVRRIEALPDAADAALLPTALAALPPRPLYGRAPDAKLPA